MKQSFLTFLFLTVSAVSALAGTISQVTDATNLPDSASWQDIGTVTTNIHSLNPVTADSSVTSVNGVTITPVAPTGGSLYLLQEEVGQAGGAWSFPTGDYFLYNGGGYGSKKTGPITLDFSSLVSGVGFLFDDTVTQDDTDVTLTAYDSMGDDLGDVVVEDNEYANSSAVFVGLADTDAEIASVVISGTGNDFAIDTVYLADSASSAAAPEPATFVLAGLLIGVGVLVKVRAWTA